jgi:dihydrofolate reductase
MIVSLIVAVSENRVIGYQGGIPWRLLADLKLFKQTTMGHTLIVGRKTYESIGRPLPGRRMMVLTRQQDYLAEGCQVVDGLPEALELAKLQGENEAFVAGGAQVYAQALPLADRIYWTQVHAEVDGDTFFPEFDRDEWEEQERLEFPADEQHAYAFTFSLLVRKVNDMEL